MAVITGFSMGVTGVGVKWHTIPGEYPLVPLYYTFDCHISNIDAI